MTDLYFAHVLTRTTANYMLDNGHFDYGAQVGALIVDEKRIIGAGVNAEIAGIRYHAEEIVLQILHTVKDLSNTTMYVTLEPCNGNPFHTRRHCCEQIADRGVGRVVYVIPKRDRNMGGAEHMRDRGVVVDHLGHAGLAEVAEMLTYGRNRPNRLHASPKSKGHFINEIRQKLLKLSTVFPPIHSEDVDSIRENLRIEIIKLDR